MGAGQCDLYKNTYGDNAKNIPDVLKGKNRFPENDSQIKHILREGQGHLPYTEENKELLKELANDIKNYHGKDERGNDWYYKSLEDDSQLWVTTRNGVIQNGGINKPPKGWDERTGLSRNIYNEEIKRGK